ncbi:probable LRR receptor-like serine/threonine-protein kinase RFK1 [Lycium barbarum]|uniref:probable LRR receptor-like serine/threonine-protein kinase RFK1 n=1 Tax=Lycium barbarum TaxID=112863 RepID=UPI00293E2944|nr:probable LRR receptor-like serine/threonine-protein kinase RFK1 [Lycium barbarum]
MAIDDGETKHKSDLVLMAESDMSDIDEENKERKKLNLTLDEIELDKKDMCVITKEMEKQPVGLGKIAKLINARKIDSSELITMKTLKVIVAYGVTFLSSNQLVGEVPTSFSELVNLTDFRINDDNFSGQIPDFIQNWKQLTKLEMHATGLEGPIPSNISLLNKLTDLRISDIGGPAQTFPSLSDIAGIQTFLSGELPVYIWAMKDLQTLDVTFNKLVGEIPNNISSRSMLKFVFLTGNMLSGDIPDSILKNGINVDLSYNNFTWQGPDQNACQQNMNLYLNLYKSSAAVSPLVESNCFCALTSTEREFFHVRRISLVLGEKLVWKDFNFVNEADGVQRPVVRHFNTSVTDNTLEIRFYWAGKGTTRIPSRGHYGPLISAISLKPTFGSCSEKDKKSVTAYIIVGVVAACIFLLLMSALWWKGNLQCKKKQRTVLTKYLMWGRLSDGTSVAVKQLSHSSRQGNREFLNEIGMISCLQHPNLVNLHGCCIEGTELLLVYEYLENNSLARALFNSEKSQLILDWPTRVKICVGIAKGLAYLHEEAGRRIVHRDIKATNVLLDRDLNPKILDFGLARLTGDDNTHISTRVAGTIGYMAPEYALWGYLTYKADVYSFGIEKARGVISSPSHHPNTPIDKPSVVTPIVPPPTTANVDDVDPLVSDNDRSPSPMH